MEQKLKVSPITYPKLRTVQRLRFIITWREETPLTRPNPSQVVNWVFAHRSKASILATGMVTLWGEVYTHVEEHCTVVSMRDQPWSARAAAASTNEQNFLAYVSIPIIIISSSIVVWYWLWVNIGLKTLKQIDVVVALGTYISGCAHVNLENSSTR